MWDLNSARGDLIRSGCEVASAYSEDCEVGRGGGDGSVVGGAIGKHTRICLAAHPEQPLCERFLGATCTGSPDDLPAAHCVSRIRRNALTWRHELAATVGDKLLRLGASSSVVDACEHGGVRSWWRMVARCPRLPPRA